MTQEFFTRYAGFLCAIHRSFATSPHRMRPSLAQRFSRKPGKPWRKVLDAALDATGSPDGMMLEFGVYKGGSIRHLAGRRPQCHCHGFDSFAGFPEDGRHDWEQDFSLPELPDVPENVTLHPGYFSQTLPEFASHLDGADISLIHVDCDIYSAAHDVLSVLAPHLKPGQIIVFDELLHYTEFATNEALAFFQMLDATGLDFEWIAPFGSAYPYEARGGDMMQGAGFVDYRAAGYYQNHAVRLTSERRHFSAAAPPAVVAALARQFDIAFATTAGRADNPQAVS